MSKAIEITKDNFQEQVVDSDTPIVLDLWAPWCGPCKMISPILDRLASEFDGHVRVGKINVDDEPELAAQFRVQSIPMLVVMKGDQMVDQSIGFRGEPHLREMFEKVTGA